MRRIHFICLAMVLLAGVMSPTCLAGTAQPITLTFSECWGQPRSAWIQEYLNQFETEHPGIKVEHQISGCNDIMPKFMTAYAGGVSPDLIMFQTFNMVGLADTGVLAPIDQFLARDGLARSTWYDSELASGAWRGVQYGLPVTAGGDGSTIIFYNTDYFAEAGLNPSKFPETFDELATVGRKLVKYDGSKIVVSPMWLADVVNDYYSIGWLYAGGGSFVSDDLKTLMFDRNSALRTADEIAKINLSWHRSPADALSGIANFTAGKSAMLQTGAWQWTAISNQKGLHFSVAARPRLDKSIPYAGAHLGTWHYVLPRGKHVDEAWELLKWLATRRDTIGDFLLRQGRLSPIKAMNSNPEYLKINKDILILAQAMSMAAPVPMLPVSKSLMDIYATAFNNVVNGVQAAASALGEACARAQNLLDEYWKTH